MANKKSSSKKSTAKKTNNTRSMAAKGYVKAPKEVKVEEVKVEKVAKKEVKTEKVEVKAEPVKAVKKTKKCNFKDLLTTKNICICAGVLVAIIIIVTIIANANNQEKKLTKYMKQLGKIYYEDIYHASFQDDEARAATLGKYTATGINTDLENLVRAVSSRNDLPTDEEILAKFVNKKTGKACDKTSTRIYFYPSEPYGVKDYTIKVNLDCGFDEK